MVLAGLAALLASIGAGVLDFGLKIIDYVVSAMKMFWDGMPQFVKVLLILVIIFFGAGFLDGIFFDGFDMPTPHLYDFRGLFGELDEQFCRDTNYNDTRCMMRLIMIGAEQQVIEDTFHVPSLVEIVNFFQPDGAKIDKKKLLLCPNLTETAPDFSDNSHLYDAQFYSGAVATSGSSGFTAGGGTGGGGGGGGAGDELGEVSPAKNCFNLQFPYYCQQNGQDCCTEGDEKCSCDLNGCSPNIGFFKGIAMLFIMLFILAWGIGRVGFNLGG
jgi:hypothetical protein